MYSAFTLALLLSTCNCHGKNRNENDYGEIELSDEEILIAHELELMDNHEAACKDKVQVTAISRSGIVENYGLLFEKNRVWYFDPGLNRSKFTLLSANNINRIYSEIETSVNAASMYWEDLIEKRRGVYELYSNESLYVYFCPQPNSYIRSISFEGTSTLAKWNKQHLYEEPDLTDDLVPDCISNLESGSGLDSIITVYKVFNKPKLYTRVCKREYEEPITCENHDGIFGPKTFNLSSLKQLTKPCKAMEIIKYKSPGKNESFMLLYVDDEYLHIIRESSETTKVKLTELFECNEFMSGRSLRNKRRKRLKGAAKAAVAGTIIKKLHRRKRKRRKFKRIVKRIAIGAGMFGTGAIVAFAGIAAGLLAFCLTL